MNFLNSKSTWKILYGDIFKIKESETLLEKGDHVWVSKTIEGFHKGYELILTEEIFMVTEAVRKGQVPMYHLIDCGIL